MLRSGLAGQRREVEAEREPVEVDATPAPREDTSWKVLTDAGFQFIGEWTQDPESLIRLDAKAPALPGVYVGLTLSGLKTRFDQYRRGHNGQRTSSRINGRISETLSAVLVATPEPSEWQELPVNTAAGLEVGLIETIRPCWNIHRAALREGSRRGLAIPGRAIAEVPELTFERTYPEIESGFPFRHLRRSSRLLRPRETRTSQVAANPNIQDSVGL